MIVSIVGLITVRALLPWLYPTAPAYLDSCVYDNGPCEDGAPWKSIPVPFKRLLDG
jgi:hypothetical protein